MEQVKKLAMEADVIVAHNAQYDIGILYSIFQNIEWAKDKTFIDTIILAKLHKNNEPNGYSLDALGHKYTKMSKTAGTLGELVLKYKLINCKDHTTKLAKTKANNFAYKNMKKLYELEPAVMHDYCIQDVNILAKLYEYFIKCTSEQHIKDYSDLLKLLIESRIRGINVSSEQLYDIKIKLHKKRDIILGELKKLSGNEGFNPLSTADVAQLLLKTYNKLPVTEKGNISIVGKWLEEQEDPVCKKIVEYRTLEKLSRDFCDNILEMQSMLPEKYKGKVYPSFTILGAETGRFSSSKPNIQQIPNLKKHKELGKLIRSAYTVPEDNLWASIDFSAQEPRMTVHYANAVKAEGANLLVLEYNKNPNLDLHTLTAELAGVSRNEAKVLLLGISYGMGINKLAASLNLSKSQAEIFLETFHSKLPYLKELDTAAKRALKTKGYITTIDGRKLRIDPSIEIDGRKRTFEYKALNKLIQGGSAGQIIQALVKLYRSGFKVICSVHDEINLAVNSVEEALEAKKIMENAIDLSVPSVGELTIGPSWGEAVSLSEINDLTTRG
jgi:DNA polymerase I-like protein with 3'-5' exonuclease and polymerase domains